MTSTSVLLAPQKVAKQRKITIAKAITEATAQEMRRDPSVFVMGEDIGAFGGVFGMTTGLLAEFGADRVRDTPISETAFIGAAVGAAAVGMKPIVELMFVDFLGVCFDAIYNLAAKQSYFSGGAVTCPMVLTTSVGGGYSDAGQHSQCLYATFAHMPGMKIVSPSNAYDAKGLMVSAMRDPNPVIFMAHKGLQGIGWLGNVRRTIVHVPEELYTIPIGEAAIVREGSDVTIVGWASTVHLAIDAADALRQRGISAEVIDIRSIVPLDIDAILKSVRRTGRLLVVDEDYANCGVAGEIIAQVSERAFHDLRSSPARIAYPDMPPPFARVLEQATLPSAEKIVNKVMEIVSREQH
jgi:pyruvate/2-oxoglutarate/acetoin dehydrogenase E1 component